MERPITLIRNAAISLTYGRTIAEALESGEKKVTRDPIKDSRKYLEEKHVVPHVEVFGRPDPGIPTLVVPHHYSRVHLDDNFERLRKRIIFSTGESIRSTALTTVFSELERIRWVVKELPEATINVGPLHIPIPHPERMVQNEFDIVYDYIFIHKNSTKAQNRELVREVIRTMKEGSALGFYPQETPSPELHEPHSDFIHFLSILGSTNFQIWPVSIDKDFGNHYYVLFAKPIMSHSANSPEELAALTMKTIARGLPNHLRGPYQEAPILPQPASGLTPLRQEPESTLVESAKKQI